MNSQILKLAQKSGATVNQGFDGTKNFVYGITMSPEELEKFSQLIVQECVNIINKNMPEFTCKEDYENLIRKAGRMDAIDEIEQHFGVEQ